MPFLGGKMDVAVVSVQVEYFCYLYNMSGIINHTRALFCKQVMLEAQTSCACLLFNFGKKSNYFPTCKDFHK